MATNVQGNFFVPSGRGSLDHSGSHGLEIGRGDFNIETGKPFKKPVGPHDFARLHNCDRWRSDKKLELETTHCAKYSSGW